METFCFVPTHVVRKAMSGVEVAGQVIEEGSVVEEQNVG